MTLSRRNVFAGLILALPAAFIVTTGLNWLEVRERTALLERIAESFLTDSMRESCETFPGWFLAGPRSGRPRPEESVLPDADVRLPRPSATELPFEFFAYDEEFTPKSVAGPRFPDAFKRAWRSSFPPPHLLTSQYTSALGPGLQTALTTGWGPGPCSILLFRQPGPPNRTLSRAAVFAGVYAVCFAVAWLAAVPTAARIRRLSREAKESTRDDYAAMVHITGSDEISSLGAVFNDSAADIRRRTVDAREREEALRRYVETVTENVGVPLVSLEHQLAGRAASLGDDSLRQAVREAHRLAMQLQNQAAVTRLRTITDATPRHPVDIAAVVSRLVESRAPLAESSGVTIDASKANAKVTIDADGPLVEQAIANVLDNAIVYNAPGGSVRVELVSYEHGRHFKLLIADSGPGVSDEQFAGLTANKRFRGDESRTRRPGERGLGLALAREVADRFGMTFDLRQPTTGGIEAEFRTRT